ncbi:MAG TPA: hypothetical protein VIJ15_02060, partial [Dermatophilaceae bacterium]
MTSQDVLSVLPWALLILILDGVAGSLLGYGPGQSAHRRNQALAVTLLGAVAAGAAIASSQSEPLSPGMLLLLIPAFRAGEVRGRWAAFAAVTMSMAVVFGAAQAVGTLTAANIKSNLQWAILALGVGLLGAWTAQLQER